MQVFCTTYDMNVILTMTDDPVCVVIVVSVYVLLLIILYLCMCYSKSVEKLY